MIGNGYGAAVAYTVESGLLIIVSPHGHTTILNDCGNVSCIYGQADLKEGRRLVISRQDQIAVQSQTEQGEQSRTENVVTLSFSSFLSHVSSDKSGLLSTLINSG